MTDRLHRARILCSNCETETIVGLGIASAIACTGCGETIELGEANTLIYSMPDGTLSDRLSTLAQIIDDFRRRGFLPAKPHGISFHVHGATGDEIAALVSNDWKLREYDKCCTAERIIGTVDVVVFCRDKVAALVKAPRPEDTCWICDEPGCDTKDARFDKAVHIACVAGLVKDPK